MFEQKFLRNLKKFRRLTFNATSKYKGNCYFCGKKGFLFQYNGLDLKTRKLVPLMKGKFCYTCSLRWSQYFFDSLKGDILTLMDDCTGDYYYLNLKEKPMFPHRIKD